MKRLAESTGLPFAKPSDYNQWKLVSDEDWEVPMTGLDGRYVRDLFKPFEFGTDIDVYLECLRIAAKW